MRDAESCNTASESLGRLWRSGENVVIATTIIKISTKNKTKRPVTSTAHVGTKHKPLSSLTDECLNSYFANLNGHKPGDLYQLVLGEVE
jgi:DNA-binding protein Fis